MAKMDLQFNIYNFCFLNIVFREIVRMTQTKIVIWSEERRKAKFNFEEETHRMGTMGDNLIRGVRGALWFGFKGKT